MDNAIENILCVIKRFWNEFCVLNQLEGQEKEKWTFAADKTSDEHNVICVTEFDMISFNFFRDTLDFDTLTYHLAILEAICKRAYGKNVEEINKLTWNEFVNSIDVSECENITEYLEKYNLLPKSNP